MSALTENRNTKELACNALTMHRVFTVKAANTIYAGSIVAVDATGYAVPASDATGLLVVGVAQHYAEAGEQITVKSGVFGMTNSTGHACANASNMNNLIYVEDDQTVGTDGGTYSIKAGVMRYVDSDGVVWAEIGNIRTS